MFRTSGKGSLVAVILLLLHLSGGQADARSVLVPMGNMEGKCFTLSTRSVLANTVMAAYQRCRQMERLPHLSSRRRSSRRSRSGRRRRESLAQDSHSPIAAIRSPAILRVKQRDRKSVV